MLNKSLQCTSRHTADVFHHFTLAGVDGEPLHIQRPAGGQDPGGGNSGGHALQASEHQPHWGGGACRQEPHAKDLRPVGTTRPIRLPRGKTASFSEYRFKVPAPKVGGEGLEPP